MTFWFEFEIGDPMNLPPGIAIGCGVTAHDYNDAIRMLDQKVFKDKSRPQFKRVVENVELEKLDQRHVIPNMKSIVMYGIWFPLGYD